MCLQIFKHAPSGTQNAGEHLAHGGGQTRGPGGEAPWRGVVGGIPPPRNLKEERVAHISNPATSGTQDAGEPLARGGGSRGWRGAPPPRGLGGCAPKS